MKPILLPALYAIAALSAPACGPAAAIGSYEWWQQQHAHDKPASSSTCRCPDCSASWSDETTVPEHQPDFDGSRGRRCTGGGKSCR